QAPMFEAPAPQQAVAEAPAPVYPPQPQYQQPVYQQAPQGGPRVDLGGAQPIREQMEPAPAKRGGFRSLLDKMTGNGPRAQAPQPQYHQAQPMAQAPQAPYGYARRPTYAGQPQAQGSAAISVGQAQPQTPAPQPMLQQVTQPQQQPQAPVAAPQNPSLLGRMEGSERQAQPRSADDQLEIPAFLRRQAN
ncbi:MAG: hypothetical protein WAZ62_16915, partial [Zavarzinia sp.]